LKQEELNQKLQKELTPRMAELIDLLGERVIREIEKNPRAGTVVISKRNGEEQYRRQIKALSDYLTANEYLFNVIGDENETHVQYGSIGK